ncbi:polymeric immunoglobulin receptor-like isoform X2 [Heterodontus francisci]|uniref:polymeric immunoglobulin receptor-like isoform X2 n=1 Tax=Heterodontus francisci TaxID=7792 RepID=UPI00355B4D43
MGSNHHLIVLQLSVAREPQTTTAQLTSSLTATSPEGDKLGQWVILIIRSMLALGILTVVWLIGIYLMRRKKVTVMINGNDFRVFQPPSLEGVVGQSIIIRCSFTYPENYTPQKIDISWRRLNFHGEFIFNTSKGYIHPDYRGRLEFLGSPYKEKTGTIRINQLKLSDSNQYSCRVVTSGHRPEMWQNIPGTFLSVRAREPQTTTAQLTSSLTATSPEGNKLGQWVILIIRSMLALGILTVVWLIGIYLMRRKKVTVMINGNDFRVFQPPSLEGVVGQSIIIRCSFTYPENYTPQKIDISWRRLNFHGEFIFNTSKGYIHPDYRGRLEFLGSPYKEKTGTIRINQLKLSDSNQYSCRVVTSGHRPEMWQNIPGTFLSVRAREPQTTTAQLTSSLTATSPEGNKLGQWVILIIRSMLALGILTVVWLIGIYLMRRKKVTVMINGNDFRVFQPPSLEGVVGQSIIIRCSFTYPENYTPQKIDISWRRLNFHGEFIFNTSKGYIHPDYRGRLEFLGSPYKEKTGTIRINQLKFSDSNQYYCRVVTSGHRPEMWQNIPGTFLSVRAWKPTAKPTTEPTTKSAASATWMPVLIGCSVLAFLLISLGLVAAVCSWKKQRRQHENIRQVSMRDISALSKNRSIDLDQQQKDPSNQSQPNNAPAGKPAERADRTAV